MCFCFILENEQKVAPVKNQTQQVQRVWTACSVLPVLLHLGLQHPNSGTRITTPKKCTQSQAALGLISCSVYFSHPGGLCNKSYFLMGGLPTYTHGVSTIYILLHNINSCFKARWLIREIEINQLAPRCVFIETFRLFYKFIIQKKQSWDLIHKWWEGGAWLEHCTQLLWLCSVGRLICFLCSREKRSTSHDLEVRRSTF